MRRLCIALAACLGALVVAWPAPAAAQAALFLGGGPTFPTGDYGVNVNSGWLVSGRLAFPVGSGGFSLGLEGFYGRDYSASYSGYSGSLVGGYAVAAYRMGDRSRTGAYVLGGIGMLTDPDYENLFYGLGAFSLGAGVDFPMKHLGLFVEGRYSVSDLISFGGLTVGLKLPH